jgi:hypothetical protein
MFVKSSCMHLSGLLVCTGNRPGPELQVYPHIGPLQPWYSRKLGGCAAKPTGTFFLTVAEFAGIGLGGSGCTVHIWQLIYIYDKGGLGRTGIPRLDFIPFSQGTQGGMQQQQQTSGSLQAENGRDVPSLQTFPLTSGGHEKP